MVPGRVFCRRFAGDSNNFGRTALRILAANICPNLLDVQDTKHSTLTAVLGRCHVSRRRFEGGRTTRITIVGLRFGIFLAPFAMLEETPSVSVASVILMLILIRRIACDLMWLTMFHTEDQSKHAFAVEEQKSSTDTKGVLTLHSGVRGFV